ncbi:hypothetical protein SLS58_008391 [Diplodia intermedia]|uniref:FAD dependent oxidoreductase domain-containing protein n=1 Tax=Diplodia intermedia TaxID=856260 RepID=A0ABR3THB2_9PEZI
MNPSLPVPSPGLSFWHRTTRAFPHLNENQHANVPRTTKFLIIGSGVSGLITAYKLIESGIPGKDILILEAREAISGASGRNAGHIRPDPFRGFPAYAFLHGPHQARKILENERAVLDEVRAFISANAIACDFHATTTFDVCLTRASAAHASASLAAYRAFGGDVSHVTYHDADAARAKTRVPAALAAHEWPAASVHPAKLCQWLLSAVISAGAGLWTHCPATEVTRRQHGDDSARCWAVTTPRGTVTAENVVHCTNAWAAHLLPELCGFVTPLSSQVHAFVPPAGLAGGRGLQSTMSLRYGVDDHYFSVHQRPRDDGTVVVGGSGTNGEGDLSDEERAGMVTWDDTGFSRRKAENSEREFAAIAGAGAEEMRHGEGLDHAWTGLLGMTADAVPLIGAVEGREGQWICAGFNGHGMARMFNAAGLVKLILGEPWEATGLPECYRYSTERISKFSKT